MIIRTKFLTTTKELAHRNVPQLFLVLGFYKLFCLNQIHYEKPQTKTPVSC